MDAIASLTREVSRALDHEDPIPGPTPLRYHPRAGTNSQAPRAFRSGAG
ncbi:MAG: hypothetical protein Ct9H300mP12_16480 [Acidimicrobiales bacterium]|nr:MAG: hypothetical protein Ct9H300mP12_16480 [Acidimicrobiales bacterium]